MIQPIGRYYIVYPSEIIGVIDTYLKRWEIVFAGHGDIIGFFRENMLGDTEKLADLADILAKKDKTLEGIFELVILPLIHEPADIVKEEDYIRAFENRTKARLSGGGIAGIYIYPIVKSKRKFDGTGPGLDRPHFLFGPSRLNSAAYNTEEWLNDVEGFLSLIPVIESRGLRLPDFFPQNREIPELMSFAAKRFHSAEYLEMESFVKQSLKEWLDRQIGGDSHFSPCLADIAREVDMIRKMGSDISADRSRNWTAPLNKYLRFFDSWNFRFLKKNYKEIKEIKLKRKLREDLSPAGSELDALAVDEYEIKLRDFERREREAHHAHYQEAMDALAGKRTTLNGLFKEIDAKLASRDTEASTGAEDFAKSLEAQVEARRIEGLFGSILSSIKEYLGGINLKRILKTYIGVLLGTSLLSIAAFFLLFKMKFFLRTFIFGNLAAAFFLTALYFIFWHYKKQRLIERNINELKKRIRLAAASAARAAIVGKAALLFGRYAVRKSTSLRRDFDSLKKRLVCIKDGLLEYRTRDLEGNEAIPPPDLADKLKIIDWEEVFRVFESWDRTEVLLHFLPKIEARTRVFYLESGANSPVKVDNNIDRVMKGILTVPFRDTETALEVLSPARIDRTAFQSISCPTRYLNHDDERAVVIMLGRKRIEPQPHG